MLVKATGMALLYVNGLVCIERFPNSYEKLAGCIFPEGADWSRWDQTSNLLVCR